MPSVQELLPMLEGWKFDYQPPRSYTIAPGAFQQTFHDKDRPGYVLGLVCSANSPLIQLEILHWGPKLQTRRIIGSPFLLNALGMMYPNGSGFWHGTYSAVAGVYAGIYSPDARVGFWKDEIRVRILNPTAAVVAIYSYSHQMIVIEDEKLWRESLRRLYHPLDQVLEIVEAKKLEAP